MANIDSESLDKYLVQVRRIAESREKGAEKQILKLYKDLVKELNGFLGNEYAKYAEDDRLTYGILQKNGEYARFLEEVNKKVDSVIPEVKSAVEGLVNDTYEKCYNGMVEGVKKSTTAEALKAEFKSVKAVRPEVVKAAVENPIPKLRLTPTLERNRKQVISGIKREIAVGLSQGDRMSTMAERINKKVNTNYSQSMLIARTEAHRVRETGLNDAANEVDEILKANGSEYREIKKWNTLNDTAVRDTHAEMDGVVVLQDEKFELPSGATADCPGTSGVAAEDCNCRCFLTHDIVTDDEFYAMTGRHFPEK